MESILVVPLVPLQVITAADTTHFLWLIVDKHALAVVPDSVVTL